MNNLRKISFLPVLLSIAVAASETPDVKILPITVGAAHEFGSINHGLVVSNPITEFDQSWVDHFGTFFTGEVIVDGHLDLKAGIGGVFEFPKPEAAQEQYGGSQAKLFFVGPSIAEGRYNFGDPESPVFSIGGGMFPFKYNSDARVLGEYLFRSIPYPTALFSGGFNVIGDNVAYLEGLRASAHFAGLKLDLLLTTETNIAPLYDWSLGLLADYSIFGGLIDIGAGANFKRLIQIHDRKTEVHDHENSYFYHNGKYYSGDPAYYREPAAFLTVLADSATARGDLAAAATFKARGDSLTAIADSLDPDRGGQLLDPTTHLIPGASYYTTAGTMVMGRLAIDLKKVLPWSAFGPEDMRIFGEAAILGLKDYEIYYTKMTERMPIMVGFNLPAFRFLDLLSFQFEYFDSPNLNNVLQLASHNWATPYLPTGSEPAFSRDSYNDLTKKDNYSWSILMSKKIFSALNFNLQIARDHYRTVSTDFYYGSRLEPTEVLYKSSSSWYWMFQIGWNI